MSEPSGKRPDIVLAVPPFAMTDYPALGLHVLQACLGEAGYSAKVWYANIDLLCRFGDDYHRYCSLDRNLTAERLFAGFAWGDSVSPDLLSDAGDESSIFPGIPRAIVEFGEQKESDCRNLPEARRKIAAWLDSLVDRQGDFAADVFGVSLGFDRINAGFSLLRAVKRLAPGAIGLVGGFCCEGDGAEGIAGLDPEGALVDFVFSGESDHALVAFMAELRSGLKPAARIVRGRPILDLDGLPAPDYSDYLAQVEQAKSLGAEIKPVLVAESSRGCWWGERNNCVFCGFGERIAYREKSLPKIAKEIGSLGRWSCDTLSMADSIMPRRVLENAASIFSGSGMRSVYYELRPTLRREDLEDLVNAGISEAQPGIETLSDEMLRVMGKGTTLASNLGFLRDASSVGMRLHWNVIWGFPGEKNEWYAVMNELIPMIVHLAPPFGLFFLGLAKFSPLTADPERFGIRGMRPYPSYGHVFPGTADIRKLAQFFVGEWDAETISDGREITRLNENLAEWYRRWHSLTPALEIVRGEECGYRVVDTRGWRGFVGFHELSRERADVLKSNGTFGDSGNEAWAIQNGLAIRLGNRFVPLVCARGDIWNDLFENAEV